MTLLPAAPLLQPIRSWVRVADVGCANGMGGIKILASEAGVGERSLRRLLTGEQDEVSLANADRIALAMGSHLTLIYGWDDEVAA